MEASSVKVRRSTKDRLDQLQARIIEKTGRKVSQQEIMERLVALGESQLEGLLGVAAAPPRDWRKALRSLSRDYGVETSWEDIDAILYGDRS